MLQRESVWSLWHRWSTFNSGVKQDCFPFGMDYVSLQLRSNEPISFEDEFKLVGGVEVFCYKAEDLEKLSKHKNYSNRITMNVSSQRTFWSVG